MDKRMAQDVEVDSLGDEWKGYILRIGGGNDKQGFPMKQGVLLPYRVRLLLGEGNSCYRPRRDGQRRRKSVRGCIVGPDIQALHCIIVKQGEQEIPGLTDAESAVPKRLGPKRANRTLTLLPYADHRHPQVLQPVEGRRCAPVRCAPHDRAEEGGRQAVHQGPQDPASHYPAAPPAQA